MFDFVFAFLTTERSSEVKENRREHENVEYQIVTAANASRV